MLKIVFVLFFLSLYDVSAESTEKYPVDICYMVADLKYSAEHGVKICEVQHGSLSLCRGDQFRNREDPSLYDEFIRYLSCYHKNGWVVSKHIMDPGIVTAINNAAGWHNNKDLNALLSNPDFLINASRVATDRYDLSSYSGFLYATSSELNSKQDLKNKYPGIVVIDQSSFPFWIDKYKMTQLFAQDELLSSFKPKWGQYPKQYTEDLASQIINDLQCDAFVIKPRGAFLGDGVIIVQKEDLDTTLKYILIKSSQLSKDRNMAYKYWLRDPFNHFLVEEFFASDLITFPQQENKSYQPTMRVAFLLVYNKGFYDVHFLGSFWKTPALSIEEEGSFMDKHKSSSIHAIRCPVAPEIMVKVKEELRIALPLLHKQMLQSP